MIVRATGDDAEARVLKSRGECLGVGDDLASIDGKVGGERFLEGDGFGGDDMNERATLLAGEDGAIDGGGEILLAEDEAGTGSAEGFVGGGGGDLRVGHRRRMRAASDEARDMGHVDEQERADFVSDLAHAGKVPDAGVGACSADDEARLFALGDGLEFVVVDGFGVFADGVEGGSILLAAEAELVAVGEVSAVSEVEAEDGVAVVEHGHVCGGVCLGTGVGLNVGVLGAEELFGAVAGEIFDDVGELAAAVVAPARIALGVLVGEDAASGFKDGFGDKVFAGDHLEAFALAEEFVVESGGDVGVSLGEREGERTLGALGHI
uniref:Uncharacterized protein n=1 Tax=mine drainage metagenome TaxID=410659 RepID=E6PYW2_9ZZZZ